MGKIAGAKRVTLFFIIPFLFFSILNISWAQTEKPGIGGWGDNLDTGVSQTGVYETKAAEGGTAVALAKYIGWVLFFTPFFGFLFMARIVIAGYEWMTAAGNSEKIELAKKRIRNAVIGIIILAILYFIVYFFINTFAGLEGYKI